MAQKALNPKTTMKSDAEAEARFKAQKGKDPFPEIPPALLNSADIHDYIEATGMIFPYDSSNLKSSSFEMDIGDTAIFWDKDSTRHERTIKEGEPIVLEPNALVFLKVKQKFRLPDYMAIRFNLRILNVHRGLLLGTGPLVDPGFEGHLLIPLHNLTNSSYTFTAGEPFIWVEFTKISPNQRWQDNPTQKTERTGQYTPFPDKKKNIPVPQYLVKAAPHEPIQNAVPALFSEVHKIASRAESIALNAKSKVNWITAGGLLAAVIAVIGFYPLITDSVSLSNDISKMISDFQITYQGHLKSDEENRAKIKALNKKLSENLDVKFTSLNTRLQANEAKTIAASEVGQIQKQISALQRELRNLKAQAVKPKPIIEKAN